MIAAQSESRTTAQTADRTRGYLVAALISVASVGLRLLLPQFFGDTNWFIQMHPAVLVAAWFGGIGPGLFATALNSAGSAYFFVPPEFSFALTSRELRLTFTAASIGALISVLTGALRQSQQQLRKALAETAAAHERYRRLLDMTPVAIFIQREEEIVYGNAPMARLVGTSQEDLIGASPMSFLHPEYRPLMAQSVERLKTGDSAVLAGVDQVWRRSDRGEVHVQAAASLVPWEGGNAIQVILRDVTAERAATQERERLFTEAQRANIAKDEFLATLSHELRTPLNVALGWLHMLGRRASVAEGGRAVDAIHRNLVALSRLVDDLLDLSGIVTGRLSLQFAPVDLADLARATAETLAPTMDAKHQRVSVAAEGECWVRGDAHRLRQVLSNLLSNASKFTPDDGVIQLHVQHDDDRVTLSVTDTGQGVEAAFLPHMFEPFRQGDTSPTRIHGGLGVGLALVRRLVEAHGGTVSAHSPGLGLGTTVEIHLPSAKGVEPTQTR